MNLEQLQSLNDDEISMLWYIVNEIKPSVIDGVILEPELFPSIRHPFIVHRIKSVESKISDTGKEIYVGLKSKLNIE